MLNKWIIENFNKEDFIHVKMDIEGGEYDVLPSMIEGGSIEYISEFDSDGAWISKGLMSLGGEIIDEPKYLL